MKFPRAADGSEGDTKGQKCSAGNEGGPAGIYIYRVGQCGWGESEGTEVFRQGRGRLGSRGGNVEGDGPSKTL